MALHVVLFIFLFQCTHRINKRGAKALSISEISTKVSECDHSFVECFKERFRRLLIYYDTNTQSANFQGNPLWQAAKRHLNSSQTVKNNEK